MTDPGTAPDNDLEYKEHAEEVIDEQDMEALAANAEQDHDVDQVIRHNLYIGWVMGLLRDREINALAHMGGNRMAVKTDRYTITVIIPYPPKDWQP